MKRPFLSLWILGTLSLASAWAQSTQDALTGLASRISEKRSQIEALTTDLDLVKADYNEQLRSLAAQRADLETQVKREQLRSDQLDRDMAEVRARIRTKTTDLGDTLPLARTVLTRLGAFIRDGVPFQTEGRLGEIETLQRLLEAGNLEAGGFLARVWNQMEAEYRLTGDNGLYRQKVSLDGKDQMVEVVRLGLCLVYFRTLDDRFGLAVKENGAWRFRLVRDNTASKQISALFDGLRKNLKEGYFPLPNPFASKDPS